ncbi:MAG: glycosyltransferase family 39 protein [Planctomycetaceae bacterium]|nr:glycosyltransferase family 39 protein [Planctomycetaceae bacterium]
MTVPPPHPNEASPRALGRRWIIIWGILCLIAIACERPRWEDAQRRAEALSGWLCSRSPDCLPILFWLLLAPLIALFPTLRNRSNRGQGLRRWCGDSASTAEWDLGTVAASVLLAMLAWWATVRVGDQLAGLPPAYHDEYSYLFQAETFRAGRTWFPVATQQPQLFDQIHVLNEPDIDPPNGRFSSRYFPGTGLWMLIFGRADDPVSGHQLAQVLVVLGVFWMGRELATNGVALLAGVLTAVSPGLLLFSNLVLAHHPTLVGLMLFFWMLLRGRRTGSLPSYALAGTGLAFAMICRPMTAAGCSLPAGLVFGVWWLTGNEITRQWMGPPQLQSDAAETTVTASSFAHRTMYAAALGGPLVVGLVGMLLFQQSITGSVKVSPYQLYTDRYTPRHVYGFYNVQRGEQRLGSQVLDHYDRWAENLDAGLAVRNIATRGVNSARWTLGTIPVLAALLVWMAAGWPMLLRPGGWGIVGTAIISLHVVHIPYWFSGIMGWHYVFESAPLLLLLVAQAVKMTVQATGQRLWIGGLLALSVAVNLWTLPPIWPGRVDVGIAELRFPREQYAAFRQTIDQARRGRTALVLVRIDPADRSMDYVTNPADLQGPVLVGRWRDESLDDIRAAFPDRLLLTYDAATREWNRVDEGL